MSETELRLQCLHIASKYNQPCIHLLMQDAGELFMFVLTGEAEECDFEELDDEPTVHPMNN